MCFRIYDFTAAVSIILGCVTGRFIYPECSGAIGLLNYFMAGFHLLLEAYEPSGTFLSQVSSGTNSSVLDLAPLWANLVLLSVDFPNLLEAQNVLVKKKKTTIELKEKEMSWWQWQRWKI